MEKEGHSGVLIIWGYCAGKGGGKRMVRFA